MDAGTARRRGTKSHTAMVDEAVSLRATPRRAAANSTELAQHSIATDGTQQNRAAAPQVFDILRDEIISLRLPPHTVLSRVDLQSRFGLSSTPIRDALLRLAEEGLVEIYPQRATIVSAIDLPVANQAQFLRRALEQEAVRLLCQRGSGGMAPRDLVLRLQEIVARQREIATAREPLLRETGAQDYDVFIAADRDFHKTLYDAAGAPDLWVLMRRHSGHIDRIRRLCLPTEGKMQEIIRDHTAIIKARAAADADGAQAAMRSHLSRSIAHWDDMRRAFPDHFTE